MPSQQKPVRLFIIISCFFFQKILVLFWWISCKFNGFKMLVTVLRGLRRGELHFLFLVESALCLWLVADAADCQLRSDTAASEKQAGRCARDQQPPRARQMPWRGSASFLFEIFKKWNSFQLLCKRSSVLMDLWSLGNGIQVQSAKSHPQQQKKKKVCVKRHWGITSRIAPLASS